MHEQLNYVNRLVENPKHITAIIVSFKSNISPSISLAVISWLEWWFHEVIYLKTLSMFNVTSMRCLYLFIIPKPVNVSRCNFQEKIRAHNTIINSLTIHQASKTLVCHIANIYQSHYKSKIVTLANCWVITIAWLSFLC